MIIGGRNTDRDVFVIAEVGGNHNGVPDIAYALVEAAAQSGADAVKFQSYTAENLVHPDLEAMPLARRFFNKQVDRFRSLELGADVYDRIIEMCGKLGVAFLTTPFDLEYLDRLGPAMPATKIASGDLTYHPLVAAAAATGKPVLLSTGMADLAEIDAAIALVPPSQRAILHCVSIYPTPDDKASLATIPVLSQRYSGATIGYSDHTVGPEACVAAVALGARILEKHFTFDTRQEIGDHRLSLDPDAFGDMVRQVRRVNLMRGVPEKRVTPEEIEMRRLLRRGVYARVNLSEGQVLSAGDLVCIRPETSTTPASFSHLIGRRLRRSVRALEPITPGLF